MNKGKLKAYVDDEDEYDDEVPYPLNKHNDSYEKVSAKTDPRRDFKASQDTLARAAKAANVKPLLSDVSASSSQKGAYKKTQKRYDNQDDEESDDNRNLLKPQVNKPGSKSP